MGKQLIVLLALLFTHDVFAEKYALSDKAYLEGNPRSVHQANENLKVYPELLCDLKNKIIYIYSKFSEASPGDPIELFLIGEGSGHDYEAIAISTAKPSDIRGSLQLMNIPVGRSVDPEKIQYWPKGERMIVKVHYKDPNDEQFKVVRGEDFVINKVTDKLMIRRGWTFTGSRYVDVPNKPGEKALSGDIFSPNAIISNYNYKDALLDVPIQANQHEVFANYMANPKLLLPPHHPLIVTIEPESKDGTLRVLDTELVFEHEKENFSYTFKTQAGETLYSGSDLKALVSRVKEVQSKGHDIYTAVRYNPNLSLANAMTASALIEKLDIASGLRIEPPPEGEYYYRAFTIKEKYRDREQRPSQPLELHLKGDIISWQQVVETWNDEGKETSLIEHSIASSGALEEKLKALKTPPDAVFFYAPKRTRLKELAPFVKVIKRANDPVLYFLDER